VGEPGSGDGGFGSGRDGPSASGLIAGSSVTVSRPNGEDGVIWGVALGEDKGLSEGGVVTVGTGSTFMGSGLEVGG